MTLDDWQTLATQLNTLPGGAQAALPDFFAPLVSEQLAPMTSDWDMENWLLHGGTVLSLRLNEAGSGFRLFHVRPDDEMEIVRAGDELRPVAHANQVSALLLCLLAIASGQLDDRRRLKIEAPGIDAAAKDLMLMTVCRLCG